MKGDDLHELAALYALDLLEGEELQAFRRELAINPEARLAVERYADTADVLAVTAEDAEPPADLEDRVLGAVDRFEEASPRRARGTVAGPQEPARGAEGSFSWFPWGVAAALALTSLLLWNQRSELSERLQALQVELVQAVESMTEEHAQRLRRVEQEHAERVETIVAEHSREVSDLQAEVSQLESDGALQNLRIAVLKSQLETAPDAQAVAVWNAAQQSGRLTVSELPSLASDQDYQLWIIDPAYQSPVSAGVFNTNPSGEFEYSFTGSEAINDINAFALSLETKGGNPTPEGPIVLVSN